MRLHRITIKRYKNLRDFDCQFSDSNVSAFIGNNGSGKSNLLEAITAVFSYVKKDISNSYLKPLPTVDIDDCSIVYECTGHNYVLHCSHSNYSIYEGERKLAKKEMDAALPTTILLYYAGETNRQETIALETVDEKYENALKKSQGSELPGYKFIDYYSTEDLGALLLTAAVYRGPYYQELLDLLGCTAIHPNFTLSLINPKGKPGQADTFWNARGFVKNYLDQLRRYVSRTKDLVVKYIMSFSDFDGVKNVAENESDFFAKLKVLMNTGYLEWIDLKLENERGELFDYNDLSEGEKQLSLLLLLLSFTAKNNCLYLFDEFDSYLHLNWQRSLSEMIMKRDVNGHVIYTTHSPGTISQIRSEELYIMRQGQVLYPESETYNRALDEIMLEHMGISMRTPEIERIYDRFKQAIADGNKEEAQRYTDQLKNTLDENDPLFVRIRLLLRRIS